MCKLKNILLISLLLFCFCSKKIEPSLPEVKKDNLATVIKNLSILSKIDTTKIVFLDDSLLNMLSEIDGFEDYLTNISKDSLINIKELLDIYTKINNQLNPKK